MELRKLRIKEIGNCGNRKLWKSGIVEIGSYGNFWNKTKMLSSLLQVLPTWPLCRERDEYSWQLFIEMMVIHSGMAQWTKTPTAVPRSGFEPRPSEI